MEIILIEDYLLDISTKPGIQYLFNIWTFDEYLNEKSKEPKNEPYIMIFKYLIK